MWTPDAQTAVPAAPHLIAAASGQFLGVDWGAFAVVFVISFVAAVVIVVFYALGLRLLAAGSPDDTGSEGHVTSAARGERPVAATFGGYLCLAIGAAAVLYGLYLIIPQFH
ncbi:hypothetical protein [Subtercola boreus]|uniref:hypothetical protein n=1 Tax=Subtercola boreus TaxID=120213 RepID=UPI00209C4F48|nr:hypothetical protein [Subtercola boreus]